MGETDHKKMEELKLLHIFIVGDSITSVQIRDFLKKKATMLIIMAISIIAEIVPIIVIMAGIWIVRYFSKIFGFEELTPIKLLVTFSEIFMIILYVILAVVSIIKVYKLFKEEAL